MLPFFIFIINQSFYFNHYNAKILVKTGGFKGPIILLSKKEAGLINE